jgi:predicted rRNA methylase YqxC with S4 and FtsJ domains
MDMRLDIYLTKHHGFTRNKAQQLIMAGLVFLNGKKVEKSSQQIQESDVVYVEADRRVHWVSRSAEKLA